MNCHRLVLALACTSLGWCSISFGQSSLSTRPTIGLRAADASPILLRNAQVITAPGEDPQRLDILIRGRSIIEIGESIQTPADCDIRDLSGKHVYPGLIDAMHELSVSSSDASQSTYWNDNVTPDYRVATVVSNDERDLSKLRSQGVTAQLLVPKAGVIKGSSCLVLLLNRSSQDRVLRDEVFQHATLTSPRYRGRNGYPDSPMGATALFRQAMYDAMWYEAAMGDHERNRSRPRPETNSSLGELAQQAKQRSFVFDAANERMAIRACDAADEFSLQAILRGSGREYRSLHEIAAARRTVLVPVDFPDKPNTKTLESIRETSLVELMHWYFAPENPRRLVEAGVEICLTTDGLDDAGKFLSQVRLAVERGLDRDVALAAVTTTPASLLGVRDSVGRIAPGMLANLFVTDGDWLDKKTKTFETWVAGERFEIASSDVTKERWVGTLQTTVPAGKGRETIEISLELKGGKLTGTAKLADAATKSPAKESPAKELSDEPSDSQEEPDQDTKGDASESSETESSDDKPKSASLSDLVVERHRLSATIRLSELSEEFSEGTFQFTLLGLDSDRDGTINNQFFATLTPPDGKAFNLAIRRVDDEQSDAATSAPKTDASENSDATQSKQDDVANEPVADESLVDVVYPLGAYGIASAPEQPAAVLFRGATIWTCGDDGVLEETDLLVEQGRISAIGKSLAPPKGALVVDARGKHITPGIIDCHSHIATDGGVNESGQAITCSVRVGDFIDNSDIAIYRQLAGGVTAANILHGSANPIGGQSQPIKFRWGASMDEMKFEGAPPGVKFALGENVKRTQSRYPNTRMGVEQILRDQFLAARQYDSDQRRWDKGERDGVRPRRDLQAEAILEVLRGDRWVHCHSYRQDEIVATLDVLEEFNVRIGTLQHILEGYKVADRIARHGAMASSFADWWAYKVEVYDAIPYNGMLMHNLGIVVSFNSDDEELGRHLNTEAAKAVKYGGVTPEEALKFVTLNPAKQLRVDDRVGSLEAGKDADLVVWSGRPLSTTTRCEQTWVDGRQYFSLEKDQQLRERDATWHAALIQHAKRAPGRSTKKSKSDEVAEEDRWLRYDAFCNAGRN